MAPQLEALRQRKEVLDRLAVLVAKGTAAKAKLLRKVIASAEATTVQLAKFGVPAPHPRRICAAPAPQITTRSKPACLHKADH